MLMSPMKTFQSWGSSSSLVRLRTRPTRVTRASVFEVTAGPLAPVIIERNFKIVNEVPPMHIEVMQTDNHPTGAGQMATPLVAPAISNAVMQLAGIRLRHTPFTPERVKKALA